MSTLRKTLVPIAIAIGNIADYLDNFIDPSKTNARRLRKAVHWAVYYINYTVKIEALKNGNPSSAVVKKLRHLKKRRSAYKRYFNKFAI